MMAAEPPAESRGTFAREQAEAGPARAAQLDLGLDLTGGNADGTVTLPMTGRR
jgi:hypothetical protein